MCFTYCEGHRPLVQNHCQACHRPGQAGLPLLTYEDACNRAAIRERRPGADAAVERRPHRCRSPTTRRSTADKSKLFA